MVTPVVLVTFHSRCGSTETLALSAAVGAVQARALIRLRRLPDADAEQALAQVPECGETLRRMHKEYVAPTEADVLGADVIVLSPPPGSAPSSPEWTAYLALLGRLAAEGKLAGKVGAIVETGDAASGAAFSDVLRQLGVIAVPPESLAQGAAGPPHATAHGRRVAEVARALKPAPS